MNQRDNETLMQYRRPVIAVRDIHLHAEDGEVYIYEAYLYMDAWVELWDCTGELYGIKPYCFKSYFHEPTEA
jgi:hypothetical protein